MSIGVVPGIWWTLAGVHRGTMHRGPPENSALREEYCSSKRLAIQNPGHMEVKFIADLE